MLAAFATAFSGTLSAVAGIFLIIAAAGVMVRKGVITQNQIDGLSAATVNIFLPCLIFAKVVDTLDPRGQPGWWALPLLGVVMALAGTGLGALALVDRLPAKRNLLPLAGMQNAGYLVLPVGLVLFPNRFDDFALYVFLFILGYNPVLWSLGKILITGGRGERPGWRDFITPPLVSNLVAIAFTLGGGRDLLPRPVFAAVNLVGTAAVPVATLVLGAVLGGVGVRLRHHFADAARTLTVKLFVLPALTVVLLNITGLHAANPLLAEFLVIEAAAAPAVGLILQVRTYGGDEREVGSIMVLSYAACTLTLPAWVAVWSLISR